MDGEACEAHVLGLTVTRATSVSQLLRKAPTVRSASSSRWLRASDPTVPRNRSRTAERVRASSEGVGSLPPRAALRSSTEFEDLWLHGGLPSGDDRTYVTHVPVESNWGCRFGPSAFGNYCRVASDGLACVLRAAE
jgi:hypothetical protein